jgi:hypothetical protein
LIPDELPAVTDPAFANAGFKAASFSTVVPGLGYSSLATRTGEPFFCGTSTATSERILIFARHAVSRDDLLGGHAHVAALDRAGQALLQHRVDHLRAAHPVAPARALQDVRRVAHRLGSAGEDDVDVAGFHRLDGMNHRLQPGSADAVDRLARHLDRHAGPERRLPGDVHTGAGLQHAAHDDVANVGGRHAGPRDGFTNHDCAEIDR